MHKFSLSHVTLKDIIFVLLVLYCFLVPFEFFLEFVFDIDTKLKPYRIVGITMLLLVFFQQKAKWSILNYGSDILLLWIHVWAMLVTAVMLTFWGDGFLALFNYIFVIFSFLIYIALKGQQISERKFYILCNTLLLSIVITGFTITIPSYFLGEYGRFSGFYKNPNYAAFALNVSILYLIHLIFDRSKTFFSFKNLLLSVLLVNQLFAVLSTGSRSGMILGVTFILLYLFVFGSNKRRLTVLATFLVLALLPLGNQLTKLGINDETNVGLNRISKIQEEGQGEIRLYIWKAGFELGLDTYFMGVGIDQFRERYFREYMSNYSGWWSNRDDGLGLHSQYLTVLIEFGLIPFILLMIFIFRILYLSWRKMALEQGNVGIYKFKFLVLLLIALYSLFSTTFINPTIWLLMALGTLDLVKRDTISSKSVRPV